MNLNYLNNLNKWNPKSDTKTRHKSLLGCVGKYKLNLLNKTCGAICCGKQMWNRSSSKYLYLNLNCSPVCRVIRNMQSFFLTKRQRNFLLEICFSGTIRSIICMNRKLKQSQTALNSSFIYTKHQAKVFLWTEAKLALNLTGQFSFCHHSPLYGRLLHPTALHFRVTPLTALSFTLWKLLSDTKSRLKKESFSNITFTRLTVRSKLLTSHVRFSIDTPTVLILGEIPANKGAFGDCSLPHFS